MLLDTKVQGSGGSMGCVWGSSALMGEEEIEQGGRVQWEEKKPGTDGQETPTGRERGLWQTIH